ncbi:unnamed protein product [[Candida] boidinii]|nr:unnamed protein product [[Candida] boidinii]
MGGLDLSDNENDEIDDNSTIKNDDVNSDTDSDFRDYISYYSQSDSDYDDYDAELDYADYSNHKQFVLSISNYLANLIAESNASKSYPFGENLKKQSLYPTSIEV